MVIDLNGVVDFIDYIGGVELTFTQEEAAYYTEVYGRTIEAGTQLCSSNMALRHMRNRTIGSDFERTRRQRDVIVALVDKILNEKTTTEIYDIADYMFSLIKTNISAKDLLAYATSILGNASKLSIDNQNVPYSDAYQYARYNGMSIISYDIAKAASRIQKFIYG
jgi:anionic cell wall polymer biosynthesis LytR-Cps2A-Psr (LCP) family protein